MLHTVIVANNCHLPLRSDAFLAEETEIFSSSVKVVCQTLSAVIIQNWMLPLSSVSLTFRENEFATDNKASLPFQSLSMERHSCLIIGISMIFCRRTLYVVHLLLYEITSLCFGV